MRIDRERFLRHAAPNARAVYLYGSRARGDHRSDSDVDLLQVVATPTASVVVDEIALSSYTLAQLEKMATHGSLFVDHVLTEAVVIFDPEDLLARVREAFRPVSYDQVLHDLRWSIQLLTDSPDVYARCAAKYNRLVLNLARTYIYATARHDGHSTFSMNVLWDKYAGIWEDKLPRLTDIETEQYFAVRRWIEKRLDAIAVNPFGSIEALIVRAWGQSRLCVALGLRLLYDGETLPPYEATDLWSDGW